MTEVLEALDYAHARGAIHRDVKPANILVDLDDAGGPGPAKLIDFGIARWTAEDPLTTIGCSMGTRKQGRGVEVVLGTAPGWEDPWLRVRRAAVRRVGLGRTELWVEGVALVDERDVQAIRVAGEVAAGDGDPPS